MRLIRRVLGAVRITTVINIAVSALSGWICWIERNEIDSAWVLSCVVAVLAAIAAVLDIRDELAAQDAAAGSGRQRRAATGMAASAATKTIEIGKSLVPRVLSEEQMSRLTGGLRSVPGQVISVPYTANETETAALAQQFIQAFRDAGWVVRPSAVLNAGETQTGGGFFFDPARVNKDTLASIASAFSAAGCRVEPSAASIEGAPFVLRIFSN
jgi:hypothetical protein